MRRKRKREEQHDRPAKKRRGGGGAWRTFVHLQSKGAKLNAEAMRALSEEYWSLDDTEHKKLKLLGEDARSLHAQGLPNYPMYSRRAKAAKGIAASSDSRPLLDLSQGDRSHFMKQIFHGQSTQFPLLTQEHDFQKRFQVLVRALAGDLNEEIAREEAEAQAKLQGLLAGTSTEEILRDRKRLKEIRGAKFVAMPHSCPALSCVFSPEQVVPESWTSTHAGQNASPNTLSEAWGLRHRGLVDDETAFPAVPVRPKVCFANHFCQCRGRGRQIRVVFQRFKEVVAKLCADDVMQAKFMEGRMVLLWASSAQSLDCEESKDDKKTSAGGAPKRDDVCYALTHLSLLYLRPWRPTLTAISATNDETRKSIEQAIRSDLAQTPENLGRWLKLKVDSNEGMVDVISIWEHLDQFDLEDSLQVSFWELSQRHTPTSDLTVFSACMVPLSGQTLWQGNQVEGHVLPRGGAADARQILEEAWPRIQDCESQ